MKQQKNGILYRSTRGRLNWIEWFMMEAGNDSNNPTIEFLLIIIWFKLQM